MYERIWMTAESYGGFILGSKALRGNLNHPGVAPGVSKPPLDLKIHIFQDI